MVECLNEGVRSIALTQQGRLIVSAGYRGTLPSVIAVDDVVLVENSSCQLKVQVFNVALVVLVQHYSCKQFMERSHLASIDENYQLIILFLPW